MIDMGSNSWRLVVYGYEPGTAWWSLTDEIREAVRVGAGMGEDDVLQPEPMERARAHGGGLLLVLPRLGRGARSRPWPPAPSATPPTATSCSTGSARDTGLEARVISGEEEARYGYLAIANSTTLDRRLRHRPRRRQRPADAPGGPPADRIGLPPARLRAHERALPARREGARRRRSRRCAAHVADELERARLVGRRRPPRRNRRHDPQPRRRGPEGARTSPTWTSAASS